MLRFPVPIHRDKYLKAGKPGPVVIIVGTDPVTYLAAGFTMPDSMPEYEWAGGLMDRPMELIEGGTPGRPFPPPPNPILPGRASQKPPPSHLFERCFLRSAGLLDALEATGIPDVRGAWLHQAGAGRTFCVVSGEKRH